MSAEQQPTPVSPNPERNTLDERAKMTALRCCLRVLMAVAVMSVAPTFARAEIQVPAATKALHTKLTATVKPAVREWVLQEAKKISRQPATAEAIIKADIQNRFAGQPLASADIEALMFVVLMEASQDAEKDLKTIMAETKSINDRKAAQRPTAAATKTNTAAVRVNLSGAAQRMDAGNAPMKDKLDSKSELGETESLRLQMAMDRLSKMMQALSNVEKKIFDTQTNIIGNLK